MEFLGSLTGNETRLVLVTKDAPRALPWSDARSLALGQSTSLEGFDEGVSDGRADKLARVVWRATSGDPAMAPITDSATSRDTTSTSAIPSALCQSPSPWLLPPTATICESEASMTTHA